MKHISELSSYRVSTDLYFVIPDTWDLGGAAFEFADRLEKELQIAVDAASPTVDRIVYIVENNPMYKEKVRMYNDECADLVL